MTRAARATTAGIRIPKTAVTSLPMGTSIVPLLGTRSVWPARVFSRGFASAGSGRSEPHSSAVGHDDPVTPEATSVGRVVTAPEALELGVETLNRDILHLPNFSLA